MNLKKNYITFQDLYPVRTLSQTALVQTHMGLVCLSIYLIRCVDGWFE